MNYRLLFSFAFAATLCWTQQANAYQCTAAGCPHWCDNIAPYAVGVTSTDLDDAFSLSEIQKAMTDWTRVSCVDLQAQYNGRINTPLRQGDRKSEIGWIERGWPHDSSAIGVTTQIWSQPGTCMTEADMEMNGEDYTWIAGSGRGSRVNLYSITLHEGGHYYGLGHTDVQDATMFPAYTGGIDSLKSDDQAGICFLYPGTDGGLCVEEGCPAGKVCDQESGFCMAPPGAGICGSCRGPDDCGGRDDVCLGYPDGNGYCGKACTGDGECGAGGSCQPVASGVSQCIRVVGGMPSCSGAMCATADDCPAGQSCNAGMCEGMAFGDIGMPCANGSDCEEFCLDTGTEKYCSRGCDWLEPTSCVDGYYCTAQALGQCSDNAVCVRGSAGAKENGATCSDDEECISLYCGDGVCGKPCASDTGCNGGTCKPTSVRGCGICEGVPVVTDAGVDAATPHRDAGMVTPPVAENNDGCGCAVIPERDQGKTWGGVLLFAILFFGQRRLRLF